LKLLNWDPHKVDMKTVLQIRIIWREPDPEPQHFAALAPKVIFNIVAIQKNATNCNSFLLFPFIVITIEIIKEKEKIAPTLC
jgi:hypothetical protein